MPACKKCESLDAPKRCSRCKTASYCSKECQVADWKTHKRNCEQSSGSDAAGSQVDQHQGPSTPGGSDGKDSGTTPAASVISRTTSTVTTSNFEDPKIVWGVKLLPGRGSFTPKRFISHKFNKNEEIFKLGELCPFTALYGIPIILFCPRFHQGKFDASDLEDNQPAVYLRIEPSNGLAPMHWQLDYPGTCYAVRRDGQPLTTHDLETMYEFHHSILWSDYFEYPNLRREPFPYEITPALYHKFSDNYRNKEKQDGKMPIDRGDGR